MFKDDRFKKIYKQAEISRSIEIWVDKATGVNYLYFWGEFGRGSITPLLDKDGKPVVTPIDEK